MIKLYCTRDRCSHTNNNNSIRKTDDHKKKKYIYKSFYSLKRRSKNTENGRNRCCVTFETQTP